MSTVAAAFTLTGFPVPGEPLTVSGKSILERCVRKNTSELARNYHAATKRRMVIVTHIWQKLSSVERDVTLIVTHFWQLFSQIFGETMLIVTNIWPNPTSFPE